MKGEGQEHRASCGFFPSLRNIVAGLLVVMAGRLRSLERRETAMRIRLGRAVKMLMAAAMLAGGAAVQAQPKISSVAGTIGPDQSITITGSGFGAGPNVVLFDDFRSASANQRHAVQAVIGQWEVARGVGFEDPKLSNGKGMRVVQDDRGALISRFVFPEPASEVFTSFIGYVPPGYKFPSAVAEKRLPTVSALKMAWLMDGAKGYSSSTECDYVLGGFGGGLYRISSNDSPGPSRFDTRRNIGWAWDTPVRFAYWIKSNGTEQEGTDGLFQATNGREQVSERYTNYKPWFIPAHARHTWDRINFVGYLRSGPGRNSEEQPASSFNEGHNFVMDDIYVAIGPNACARVEIGNAPTYAACTRLTLATTGAPGNEWSDTSIRATIRQGVFTEEQLRGGYLYITDGQGRVNAEGFPLAKVRGAAPASAARADKAGS